MQTESINYLSSVSSTTTMTTTMTTTTAAPAPSTMAAQAVASYAATSNNVAGPRQEVMCPLSNADGTNCRKKCSGVNTLSFIFLPDTLVPIVHLDGISLACFSIPNCIHTNVECFYLHQYASARRRKGSVTDIEVIDLCIQKYLRAHSPCPSRELHTSVTC